MGVYIYVKDNGYFKSTIKIWQMAFTELRNLRW